jgi:hypothetical protein
MYVDLGFKKGQLKSLYDFNQTNTCNKIIGFPDYYNIYFLSFFFFGVG